MPAIIVGTATRAAYAARRFIVSLSCKVIIDRFTEMAVGDRVADGIGRLVEPLQVIRGVAEILPHARAERWYPAAREGRDAFEQRSNGTFHDHQTLLQFVQRFD